MAFDAGTIIAHFDVDLEKAKAKIDSFEHELERAARDRNVKLSAVFDQADLNKGRRLMADFDRQISRDAAQRMRSDPNGSVLGALNALFSPHQLSGAPTAQQAASSGMLGRLVSEQGVADATRRAARDTAEGVADEVAKAAATDAVDKAAADTAAEIGRRRFSFARLFGRDVGKSVAADAGGAVAGGGGGGRSGFGGLLLRGLFGQFGSVGGGNIAGGLLGGIGPGILGVGAKGASILGIGGGILGSLPALLAPLAGLGVGALGIGAVAGGAALLAKSSKAFKDTMTSSMKDVLKIVEQSAKPLLKPLEDAFKALPGIMKQIEPLLKGFFSDASTLIKPLIGSLVPLAKEILPEMGDAFKAAAPLLKPLLLGLGALVGNIFPGLTKMLDMAMPAVKVFAQILGTLGSDLGKMFAIMAPVLKASSVILKALFDLLGAIFPLIGHLAAIFASALAPAFSVFASVVRALLPTLKILGTILGDFAGAVLGDLSSAFGALATLLKDITPSLNLLAKVLGVVFNTLENAGVFAILGDALEAAAKPLARLINAIVNGLAPILPVVSQLISSMSGILINLLVKAINLLVPIAIQLVNDALKPLLPVVKALVPIITAVAQALGTGLAGVIEVVAPILAKMAPYILAVVAAIKAWAIIQGVLNFVLDANPIGVIALAVAALITGIILLVTHWKEVWNFIKQSAEDAWNFLTHGWGQYLVPGITLIRDAISFLRDHWKQIWGDIKQVALDIWGWISQTFGTDLANFFTKTIPGWWDDAVNFFTQDFVDPLKQALSDLYQWVWTDFGQKINNFFTKTIPGWVQTGVGILSRAWGDIENVIRAPVDWVITHVINNGLIAAFDWISKAVGGPHIDPIPGFTHGGKMPGYGGGDSIPILVEPGEAIVDKDRTRKYAWLLSLMGVPGFQGGGGIFGKLFDTAKIIAAVATGNTTALTHAFEGLFGITAGGAIGDMASLLVDIPKTLITDSVKFLISQFQSSVGGISGNVQSYKGDVLRVLSMLSQPAGDLAVVLRQMTTESGGNPVIVNKWDSNWVAGHPSVGLMQVIAGTFDAYAGPFRNVGPFLYGVSTNALANIYAGLNYAIHRYGGSWTSVLGQGHGYDNGGWMKPGLSWNLTGGREAVLTPGQSEAFVSMAQMAEWFRKGGNGGGGMRDVYLMLPEGSTVADALAELNFQLTAGRLQAVP